ncbi:HAD family hydrolase [Nocardia sp. NPDC050712]|uniref:HAD family hydrolase n=1 Tax=Nocardia sp. NPDC050712 TaxID=3155518 RepID=UPI0033E30B80
MVATDLASWTDGAARTAIVEFVERVTDEKGPGFVEPAARVAVFDNDGTLWCEKPMPIQLDFTIGRLGEIAADDPELRNQQPWQAAYTHDLRWLGAAMVKHYHGDDADLKLLMGAVTRAFDEVTVEDYDATVTAFFARAEHPGLHRPYRSCGYLPMVELLRYLQGHGFTNYIASGGDRDFMRPVAEALYGIPPERVIGSALGLTYRGEQGQLLYKAAMDFFDDGPEKPVRIWSRIGRRPILSVGNSNGDLPMLEFCELPDTPALRLLILHDDSVREFDYTDGAEDILAAAQGRRWSVVSMRNDWREIFTPTDGPGDTG